MSSFYPATAHKSIMRYLLLGLISGVFVLGAIILFRGLDKAEADTGLVFNCVAGGSIGTRDWVDSDVTDDWDEGIININLNRAPALDQRIDFQFYAKVYSEDPLAFYNAFGPEVFLNGLGGGEELWDTWESVDIRSLYFDTLYTLSLPADLNNNGSVDWIVGVNEVKIRAWSHGMAPAARPMGIDVIYCPEDPAQPDLIIVAPLSAPAGALISGNTLTFNATVKNQGGSASGANSTTRFKIDTDNNGSYDVTLTDQTTGNLVANGTEAESAAWTAVAGTHKYQVCADNGLSIAESNEGNNCAVSGNFTVATKPDLRVYSPAINPASPNPGDNVTFSATVINEGGSSTVVGFASSFCLDLKNDPYLSCEVNLGTDGATPVLAPNSTDSIISPISWTASSGTHTARICADSGNAVDESDEGDNCVDYTFTVGSSPDFLLFANPNNIIVLPSGATTSIITVQSVNGFKKEVTLSITPNPADCISTAFNPAEVTPLEDSLEDSTVISNLTIQTNNCAVGNYTITVAGAQGSNTRTTNIALTVASSIGNTTGYAWSQEAGRINFKPIGGGVTVSDDKLTGYAKGDEAGWINLDCAATPGECPNNAQKVTNDGAGNLSGFAWGAEIGWLNFNCQDQGGCLPGSDQKVEIDGANGNFKGYGWSAEIGWVSFEATDGADVNTSWRTLADLIAQNLQVAGALTNGSSITFTGAIKNQGLINANASKARFCLDNSNCLTNTTDRIGNDQDIPALNVEEISNTIASTVWTATAGSHTIYFCADVGVQIIESDENNNCASSEFTIANSNFSLSANPAEITALAYLTSTRTSVITVTSLNNFSQVVDLTAVPSNPACINPIFSEISVTPDKNDSITSNLFININNCPVGSYFVQITGKNRTGSLTQQITLNIKIQTKPTGNTSGYAWGENTGWISFSCNHSSLGLPLGGDECISSGKTVPDYGVLTDKSALYGYAWGENIGWISMNCDQRSVGGIKKCAVDGGVDYAIANDGDGKLAGYAWSENIGWISFDDLTANNYYQVTINENGVFSDYGWSETAGYISFKSAGQPEYYVQTEWLGMDTPPQTPIPINPTDGQDDVSVYLEQLKWKSGDADGDNLQFKILDLNGNIQILNSNGVLPNTIFSWPNLAPGKPGFNLEPNTDYDWQVEIWDPVHELIVPESAVIWNFTTEKDNPYIRTSEDVDNELNFGTVKIGATKTMYVVVCNFPVKDDKLTTSNISLTAGVNFSLGDKIYPVDENGTMASKDIPDGTDSTKFPLNGILNGKNDGQCLTSTVDQPSYNIMVKFSPGDLAVPDDTLNIYSNDPNTANYQITLKGDGEALSSPDPVAPSGGVKIRR